ncbi:hypothetical protein EII22_03610 [Coriobacteriales bacterium OH1046]|nr:hypothetical protein EII22_03610 [Coriobacteriales bacterium OH1046]
MRKRLLYLALALLACLPLAACGDGMSPNAIEIDLAAQDSVIIVPWHDDEAPHVTVGLPDWLETAKYEPLADDASVAEERIGCLWARGSVDIAYASDDAEKYLLYQLDTDNIVGSRLFGSRYTDIETSGLMCTTVNGHEVLWGWYRFDDEYDRPNMFYVSAIQVDEGNALEIIVAEPSIREGGIMLDESYLFSLWEGVSW